MSKEEIVVNNGEAWKYSNRLRVVPYVDVLTYMDQYAAQQNAELLLALEELREKYLFNQTKAQAKNNHMDETLIKVENAINKAKQ